MTADKSKTVFFCQWETAAADFPLDADNLSNIPIEVKSGKDYTVHSALDKFISNDDYNIKKAYVLSNEREVFVDNGITYVPIYYIMFFQNNSNVVEEFLD